MEAARNSALGVLGAMRIKNESRHLREVLERALTVCNRILVLDDHSTDNTAEICGSFGERVCVFPSPFDGFDEARDKNFLLQKVVAEDPEWVLWIDGDEVLERSAADMLRPHLQDQRIVTYSVRIAFVWDNPDHVRIDGIWGNFTRPSLFRVRGQLKESLGFPKTRFFGNLHCGNVPAGLQGESRLLDLRLKHYGYMDPSQRRAKYEWYSTNDTHNAAEDEYRHLAEIPGARHAPGPPRIVAWQE
jgi:glycosyltransferase involved in cell wall biosynthesis